MQIYSFLKKINIRYKDLIFILYNDQLNMWFWDCFMKKSEFLISLSYLLYCICIILFAILYYGSIIMCDISFPFFFTSFLRIFEKIYITAVILWAAVRVRRLVGGISLLHIITFSRADTRGTSNLKFGELLQMLNSPKVPLELL